MHILFDKIKKNINLIAIIVVLIISLIYVFSNYSGWLTSECIAPQGADIKFHAAMVRGFVEQFNEYGFVYPIDYLQDTSGFYWYTRGVIPFIPPALLTAFLPFNTAFYLFYLISYILLILGLYFLVKSFSDEITAVIISLFFLLSNISNMMFSVGGNYHFIVGLIFFFVSIAFFLKYNKNKNKKDLILFVLSALAVGFSYIYSFVFLISFTVLYSILNKRKDVFKISIFMVMIMGIYLIPAIMTGNAVAENISESFMDLKEILKLYVLPSTFTSWIYQPSTEYQGPLDFNQGIHLYLAGIIGLLYLYYKKVKSEESKVLFTYLITVLGWLALPLIFNGLPFEIMKSFFIVGVPLERLMTHIILGFLFLSAYALYKISFDYKSFLAVGVLGILASGFENLIKNKLFYALIGISIIFFVKWLVDKKKIQTKNLILSSVILFLLLFPLTGEVETTNLEPRNAFFVVDNIKDTLTKEDVFYFAGGWSLQEAIMACTGVSSIVQIDRDLGISRLSDEINVFEPSLETKEYLEKRGITKLIIALEEVLVNSKINQEKIKHLVLWYGIPKGDYFTLYGEQYPIMIFNIIPQRDYSQNIVEPTEIKITLNEENEKLLTNIEFHSWWRAEDKNKGKEIQIKNDKGLILFEDVKGTKEILLKFSWRYFIIGGLISLIGLFLVADFVKKTFNHRNT